MRISQSRGAGSASPPVPAPAPVPESEYNPLVEGSRMDDAGRHTLSLAAQLADIPDAEASEEAAQLADELARTAATLPEAELLEIFRDWIAGTENGNAAGRSASVREAEISWVMEEK